jgi:hypothetical protein
MLGDIQWHNVHIKFNENQLIGSNLKQVTYRQHSELENTQKQEAERRNVEGKK